MGVKPGVAKQARRWLVHGRVQGVGYRYFAQRMASELGLTGYARNLDNGSVEVYAAGTPDRLSDFAGRLRQGRVGPRCEALWRRKRRFTVMASS